MARKFKTVDYEQSGQQKLTLGCKAGGGLVLGTSNAVQQEVPIENYRAVIRAWEEYGQY